MKPSIDIISSTNKSPSRRRRQRNQEQNIDPVYQPQQIKPIYQTTLVKQHNAMNTSNNRYNQKNEFLNFPAEYQVLF